MDSWPLSIHGVNSRKAAEFNGHLQSSRYSHGPIMTKHNLLASLLTSLLAVLVLISSILAFVFIQSSRQTPLLQAKIDEANRSRNLLQGLARDMIEYSGRNPAINPILQQFGLKPATPAPAPAPAPAPSAKSPTKK